MLDGFEKTKKLLLEEVKEMQEWFNKNMKDYDEDSESFIKNHSKKELKDIMYKWFNDIYRINHHILDEEIPDLEVEEALYQINTSFYNYMKETEREAEEAEL